MDQSVFGYLLLAFGSAMAAGEGDERGDGAGPSDPSGAPPDTTVLGLDEVLTLLRDANSGLSPLVRTGDLRDSVFTRVFGPTLASDGPLDDFGRGEGELSYLLSLFVCF